MSEIQPVESPRREVAGHEFRCGTCGAAMEWDPKADALVCEYCEVRTPVPREEGTIVEHGLEEAADAARGFGLEVRVSRCHNCGARIAFDGASTSEVCVYCGSASVLTQEANRAALRPESLIPLGVDRERVERRFREWLDRQWLAPRALRSATLGKALGVYVPFWVFDCRIRSSWTADAGEPRASSGRLFDARGGPRSGLRRGVRWSPVHGGRDDGYDDWQVPGSEGLSRELVSRLGGFDTSALVPYRPEYLAGWRAEEYRVDLQQAWELGRQAIEERQRLRCAADVPGETHRQLRVHNVVSDVRWKHVLLPIWSLQYRFRGEVRTVLVNGQTGVVSGSVPHSPMKLALVFLLVALLVVLLGVASNTL